MTSKDEEFFRMLYCCGVITDYGLQPMKISKYKLKKYKENNLIDIAYENGKKGYKLTSKAKSIMAKFYGLKKSYTFRSIKHCSKLQHIYLNVDLDRYQWITENEAVDLLNNKLDLTDDYYEKVKLKEISPVDVILVDTKTKRLYGIEIVSQSYRERDLDRKEKFLGLLNIEAIFLEC